MGITTVETQTKTVVTTMEKPHKRVGIFGGTFNPPHYAHLVIAQHIQEELELDRIHFCLQRSLVIRMGKRPFQLIIGWIWWNLQLKII